MSEPKTFRVDWRTGYIKVNVGNFFGGSNQKGINKLLKLARTYCTSDQQAVLLQDLKEAKRERAEAIAAMAALRLQMQKLAEPFFANAVRFEMNGYEKALIAQHERIDGCIKKVKATAWRAA